MELDETRSHAGHPSAGFFRTTVTTGLECVGEGLTATIRRNISLMLNRSKTPAGLIFHGGKHGDHNTTDQQSFSSIAASAVACGFEHDIDNGLSDEFHGRLPEYW